MAYVWPLWLVVCCVVTLLAVFRPKGAARGIGNVLTLLGAATFLVWLTDGGFLLCLGLGFAVAYPSLGAIFLLLRPAPRPRLPAGYVQVFASQALVPSLLWGTAIGVAFGLGGRLTGSAFVAWRACVGGGLVWLVGAAWLWQLRAKPIVPPAPPSDGP